MELFSIKIGKKTKKGGFIEHHSFVCKTDNGNIDDVKTHWLNHYSGLDIQVNQVVNIVETTIKESISITNTEKKEIRELKNKIRLLEDKKEIERFKGTLEKKNYPKEAKEIMPLINDIESKLKDEKNKLSRMLEEYLLELNKDKIHWVDGKLSESYGYYTYEMLLKGKLIKEKESDLK
jgi:hypothetical protein